MSPNTLDDLFLAAALQWFHDNAEHVISRLDDALENSRPGHVIEWRTDTVTDFRGHTVPASGERLVRWDSRHPNVIFRDGFRPQYAAESGDGLADEHADLHRYVRYNAQSIFVGTARYYRNENNSPTRWVPREIGDRFEYEIYAHGGIDVNLSLGYHHRYFNQREIAFPGGIRPEFIRTAREYNSEGRIVRIWVNGGFDIAASGQAHSSRLCQLPDPVCGSQVPVVYWWGEDPDQPGPSHRELRNANSQLDAMREEGDQAVDTLMAEGNPILPVKFISGDDAPTDGHEYAINILGTTKVLTSTNNTKLTLETWHGQDTQRFRCVTYDGYTGFICKGAGGGSGRYMGYNSSEVIVFQAHYQGKWEHVLPRADPAGGFTLWMFKDDHLAPILQVSATQFKMMAQSDTRFGFTQLDNLSTSASTPPDFWGQWPSGTDHPGEGHTYAIKIYGTNKAFTCVDKTELALHDFTGDQTQRFRCVTHDGFMGFICEGADYGKGRYLGFDSSETLSCQAYYQRKWENFHARADPAGGFKLYMKKDDHLAPVAKVGADKMKMMAESETRVSFTKLS
ncbi:hypothetical protein F5Y07DRAFT_411191 [Xylaria sp. FL0933]|nr:hypothetical protein F5Y07DRAFT_411191 [Xylaria sp. FL0933]